MKRFQISAITILLILICLSACGRRQYRSLNGGVWNTTYNITYNSENDLDDSILAVMRQVELSLSPFCDSSLISRINRGEDCRADSLLRRIFLSSVEVNRLSKGAFDPTVAPLVNLWGFGYKNSGVEPTQAMIDSVMPFVGIDECSIDADGHIVKKSPSTEFNFSAITKGYGCDLIGEMLRRNGCTDYLIEIGGEIALSGKNPRGEDWRIMIDAPIDNDTAVVHERMAVIQLGQGGVATSGNYRNYRESDGKRSWHTISSADGRPAVTDLLSVTVLAQSAMMADALATSCMAMQADSALKMIEGIEGVEVLLVTFNDTDSTFKMTSSRAFPMIY